MTTLVTILGNIGNDVNIMVSRNGVNYTRLRIPVETMAGDENSKVTWMNITVFGAKAQAVSRYCAKGSKVQVTGRLYSKTYKNEEGRSMNALNMIADHIQFIQTKSVTEKESQDSNLYNSADDWNWE